MTNKSADQLYRERFDRYTTALRNGVPDRIPIRPFAAEFTAKYAGYTCQEVTHDYEKAFAAVRKCATDFDWDAVVPNMVYVWTGLTQAIGLNYYGVPGIHVPADTGFQYREPSEERAHMLPEEYDHLIDDPTGFLFNVWLPRVSDEVSPLGTPTSYRNNLSFLKGGMAMLSYFTAFGPQIERLRTETGTLSAIGGNFKAPLDIIGDKLRGYLGLTMDLLERPEKVQAACEALMPHLLHMGLSGADPEKHAPIGFWMHRGCTPFVTQEQFDLYYWPTLKPIIEAFWSNGHQTLFYAEGDWTAHLEAFAELPEGSMVFHLDRTDVGEAARVLGKKFCLSGGIPNALLAYGTPDEVRAKCKQVIDTAAQDGGYIMDASAIIQNDARVENVKAMTDFTRGYGVYGDATGALAAAPRKPASHAAADAVIAMPEAIRGSRIKPGACIAWEEQVGKLPAISGDAGLVRKVWEDVDALGYMYIWHCLLSF
ncbi:MAG: uroporphyrinogen decarboxylase family protein [FCB group bacterium]|nr:uroporphyrinogen decarboxylase family protein [FCB group bacterium]